MSVGTPEQESHKIRDTLPGFYLNDPKYNRGEQAQIEVQRDYMNQITRMTPAVADLIRRVREDERERCVNDITNAVPSRRIITDAERDILALAIANIIERHSKLKTTQPEQVKQ